MSKRHLLASRTHCKYSMETSRNLIIRSNSVIRSSSVITSRYNEMSDHWRMPLLLLTWIDFRRSGGTVNFILPFMTKVTISISISQIFRSWVAIYQLRPPTASLSHSLYDMPELVPRMNVLFWGRHDFQISFSNRYTSRNAWNRPWRSFCSIRGPYQTIRSSSFTNA